MKVVILAGGYGTRLAEETDRIPKPMVPIGGKPILWHIMKMYSRWGFDDFIICGGYKSHLIVEYFANYQLHNSNVFIDLAGGSVTCLSAPRETWKISIIDTGEGTETGGRLLRVRDHLTPGEPFCMTYGDGVSDVDLSAVVDFHRRGGHQGTLTAVRPPARFGATVIEGDHVVSFAEKPAIGEAYINGGFFVLEHSVLDLIEGDAVKWEFGPLETMARNRRLGGYVHDGFWQPMDTLRDHRHLEQLWAANRAPWKWWP
jgi:glucose-1-phosphate cytidylyltransferase